MQAPAVPVSNALLSTRIGAHRRHGARPRPVRAWQRCQALCQQGQNPLPPATTRMPGQAGSGLTGAGCASCAQVGPFANPNEVYGFYNLPYCQPDDIEIKREDLGPLLKGDRPMNTLYEIKFGGEHKRYARMITHSRMMLAAARPTCLAA